jgi:glycosyltransferase involved in cell wall biosynthesis
MPSEFKQDAPFRPPPKVSIAMITYNHEKFIAQAMESVLAQQTDFPIELVIGEDCSTDGTREIVEQFAARYPDVIRPILHEKNVGMHRNGQAVLEACNGEYLAFLEGDDYWTNPAKLQSQVLALSNAAECVGSIHAVDIVRGCGNEERFVEKAQYYDLLSVDPP